MKAKLLATLIAVLMFIPCVTHAGVLENGDLDDYQYQTFGPGGIALTGGVIYSQSVQGDFCVEGLHSETVEDRTDHNSAAG
jgi:hypothetical protein